MTNKYIPIVFLFAAVLLIPGGAFANSNSLEESNDANNIYYDGNKLERDFDELPNPMAANIETNETVLKEAHSKLTQIMIAVENDTEEFDDNFIYIPYTVTYIDDDVLVVGISPDVLLIDWPIYEQDIVNALGMDAPIQIVYMEFVPESEEFTPYNAEPLITEGASGSSRTDMPCDSSGSLYCYYYKLLKKKCDAGTNDRRANTYKRILNGAGWDANALCRGTTTIAPPVGPLTNLSVTLNGNTINVTWDASGSISKIYVYTYADNRYVSKVKVSGESFTASNLDAGKTYKFKVKVYPTSGNAVSKITTGITIPAAVDVDHDPHLRSKILANNNITLTWDKPSDIKKYKLYVEKDNKRKTLVTNLSKTATSYTYTNTDPGHDYKLKLKVYYTKRTAQYGYSQYFDDGKLFISLSCAADQKVQSGQCVDRCPASNEQWRNDMCIVTSCSTGKVIKNNACVDRPVVKAPAVNPLVINQTSVTPTNTQCTTSTSTRGSGDTCEDETFDPDAYYQSRITDRVLSGGDSLVYAYGIANDDATQNKRGTITIGAIKDGQNGLVTAAHNLVPERGHVPIYQQIRENNLYSEHMTEFTKVYQKSDYSGKKADAAFLPIRDIFTLPTDSLTDHMGQTINIVGKGGLTLPVDTSIQLVNSTHTMPGTIKAVDVTIRDDHNLRHPVTGEKPIINHKQIVGYYSSAPGNSGSPIITTPENGDAQLIGLHVGKLCQYLDTDNKLPRWVPRNDCRESWKVITPWEGVIEELGIDE